MVLPKKNAETWFILDDKIEIVVRNLYCLTGLMEHTHQLNKIDFTLIPSYKSMYQI